MVLVMYYNALDVEVSGEELINMKDGWCVMWLRVCVIGRRRS